MDPHSEQKQDATIAPVAKRRPIVLRILGILVAVIFVLFIAGMLVAHLMVSTVARNESNAAESLRALTVLEQRYAAAHPSKGFTCEFAHLRPEAPSSDERKQEEFLFSNPSNGYKFELKGCEADSNGVTVRYKATAEPLVFEKTGFRAFCIDERGELQYAVNGSAQNCRPLT